LKLLADLDTTLVERRSGFQDLPQAGERVAMMRARNASYCLAASMLLVGFSSIGLAGEPITIESLLAEMVTRETVARLPATPYTCRQSSSYDRRSVDPEDASTWFANADSNN
jgi:hypothetical protein